MNRDEYIRSEVKRQMSTDFEGMTKALNFALAKSRIHPVPTEHELMMLAMYVEWTSRVNELNWRDNNYRTTPVTIGGKVTGTKADLIPRAMNRMMHLLDEHTDPDEAAKMLVEIHPWADGNGRTASIFRNWLMGTLDDPEPLPYYYGHQR